MADNDDSSEPDRVHSPSLNRRQALALGTGLMSGLAGCSGGGSSGDSYNANTTTSTAESSLAQKVELSPEYAIDEISLELDIGSLQVEQNDSVEFTVRIYTSPNLDRDNWSKIGEERTTQSDGVATQIVPVDLPTGYAQQLHFTLEVHDPTPADEEEVYKTGNMVMPFENKAEGETQVRLLSPRKPSDYYDWMNPPNGPLWETQFWYDSPDESPFGTPTVPEDKYDPNWYEYRNITVTALIKYPSFENIDAIELDEHGEVPVTLFDAFVFSFTLDQWELLEAFRWNSIANQKLERGQYEHSSQSDAIDAIDDPQSRGSAMIARSSFFDNVDASTAPPLYEQYNTGRYSFREYEKLRTNPIKVTSGRPITYRIAQAIEDATDNPSFNTHETVEYHKAIALETFVGFTGFSFDFGSYSKAPEELLNRWFLNSQGEDADTGNCQDGTNLYCGIAAHLLDVNVGWVSCLARGVGHATAGVLDLQLPEEVFEVWDECPFGSGGEPFTLDTDYGDLHMVEATSPDPMIGWKLTASGQVELETYLPTASVQSHVPLNNDYEPAMDGTVRTGDSDPEIPWEYHKNHETLADVGG